MRYRRLLILPVAGLLIAAPAAPLAVAQSTTDQIVHRQSVLTEVDATGTTGVSRVFTQVAVPEGRTLTLPGQSTSGLRSLSGGAPTVDAGTFVFGGGMARMVANNTADLPVSIEIQYAIDGRPVSPDRVAGHDGQVAVTYIVRNLTAVPTELTLVAGDGSTSTQTVDVSVPMVGSLSLTLPSAYRDVVAPGAVVVGDGRGGTVVNWSLLLFSPLGSETQEVTWTAQARDAVIPAASMQVVPVTPNSFGSLGATEQAYAGAVEATTALTDGARQIDSNLQRLADGAGELLAGLLQLRDGAQELAVGLNTASNGAGDLSSGLVRARTGADQLDTGLGDLADGAGRLADGASAARTGAGQLDTGLGELATGAKTIADALAAADAGGRDLSTGLGMLSAGSGDLADGLGDLADGAALVDANTVLLAAGAGSLSTGAAQVLAGIQLLSNDLQGPEGLPFALAGIDLLQAGIGAIGTENTLLDGLFLLDGGLVSVQNGIGSPAAAGTLRNGVALIGGGLNNPSCDPFDPPNPANPCGVTQFNGAIGTLSGQVVTDLQAVLTDLSGIDTSPLSDTDEQIVLDALATLTTNATRAGTIQAFSGGITAVVGALQTGLAQVDGGLVAMAGAIGDPATADTLRNGVFRITAGVSNPLCDPTNPSDPANPCGLLEGLNILEYGLETAAAELAAGLGDTSTPGTLLWGADQVATGSSALADGATQLQEEGTSAVAAGADAARDGADLLADGAEEAAAGGAQLSSGLGLLADGGQDLSAGATLAADGSGALVDGLGDLAAGAELLDAGALRAATGGADLADGLGQLDDGARRLAAGLEDAADGSQLLADGQVAAADGGQQIADGSQQLVDEGTSVLAGSVSDATVSSSLQLEQVRAVAARGVAGDGLPYPTAEGAEASAVYQFDLAGVGSTDGAGLPGRLGIGLVALAAALMLGAFLRPRPQSARIPEAKPELLDV
jgi:putative membrane protein